MNIPHMWLIVLRHLHDNGFPEAVIAGGALRDLYFNGDIKDVDIFVKAQGAETGEKLESIFDGFACTSFYCLLYETDTPHYSDQMPEIHAVYNLSFKGFSVPFQIIALNIDVTPAAVMERFDMGICRIVHNGTELFVHQHFRDDVASKQFTLRCDPDRDNQLDRTKLRHHRITEKAHFSGWPLVNVAGNVLQKAPEPFVPFIF